MLFGPQLKITNKQNQKTMNKVLKTIKFILMLPANLILAPFILAWGLWVFKQPEPTQIKNLALYHSILDIDRYGIIRMLISLRILLLIFL